MTVLTKLNATKMTSFYNAYWAAKAANNVPVLQAAKRMLAAADKYRPAAEADWEVMRAVMK
jgi:hypothetical protein